MNESTTPRREAAPGARVFHVFGHPVVVRTSTTGRARPVEADHDRTVAPGTPFVDPQTPQPPASWAPWVHQLLRARRSLGALATVLVGAPFLLAFASIGVRALPAGWRPWVPWAIVAGFMALVASAVWRAWRASRGYSAPRDLAAELGLAWYVTAPALARRWHHGPFAQIDGAVATEVVTGTWRGHEVVALHHSARQGSKDSAAPTRVRRVAAIALPAALPWVELTPQGAAERVLSALGGQDLVFESAAFNDAWRVRVEDARVAHALLHPRVMERLLRPDADGLSVLVDGPDLLVWTEGDAGLEDTRARFDLLVDLVERIPGHVWADHTRATPPVWHPAPAVPAPTWRPRA